MRRTADKIFFLILYLKQPMRYMVGILITKANMSSMKVLRACGN